MTGPNNLSFDMLYFLSKYLNLFFFFFLIVILYRIFIFLAFERSSNFFYLKSTNHDSLNIHPMTEKLNLESVIFV